MSSSWQQTVCRNATAAIVCLRCCSIGPSSCKADPRQALSLSDAGYSRPSGCPGVGSSDKQPACRRGIGISSAPSRLPPAGALCSPAPGQSRLETLVNCHYRLTLGACPTSTAKITLGSRFERAMQRPCWVGLKNGPVWDHVLHSLLHWDRLIVKHCAGAQLHAWLPAGLRLLG